MEYPHDPAHGSHPEHEGNQHPRWTWPSCCTLRWSVGCHGPCVSQGRPRWTTRRPTPTPCTGWLPAARSGDLGDRPHVGVQKAGRKEKRPLPCCSWRCCSPLSSRPASCWTAAFFLSSPSLLVVPTSRSDSSYSAQQLEPFHCLQASRGFAGPDPLLSPSSQGGTWTRVGTLFE